MSKATTATKAEKGATAHVLDFKRPTRTAKKPLIFEFAPEEMLTRSASPLAKTHDLDDRQINRVLECLHVDGSANRSGLHDDCPRCGDDLGGLFLEAR